MNLWPDGSCSASLRITTTKIEARSVSELKRVTSIGECNARRYLTLDNARRVSSSAIDDATCKKREEKKRSGCFSLRMIISKINSFIHPSIHRSQRPVPVASRRHRWNFEMKWKKEISDKIRKNLSNSTGNDAVGFYRTVKSVKSFSFSFSFFFRPTFLTAVLQFHYRIPVSIAAPYFWPVELSRNVAAAARP